MSALVIFSPDVPRLARFYESVLEAHSSGEKSGDIRLFTERDEVLIHSLPKKMVAQMSIQVPPDPRDASPLKPAFDVRSLPRALQRIAVHGGVVTGRTFRFEEVTRHDVLDPDGNVIQLRCRTDELT